MPAPDAVMINYAKLRSWRDEAGLRRERVCADLEMSAPYLYALETGKPGKVPSLAMLHKLAAYYGHDPAELLLPSAEVAS